MKLVQRLTSLIRGGAKPAHIGAAARADSPPRVDPNAHVDDYLSYYRTLRAPGFAVLVTGDWGVGKTRLVKRLLRCDNDDSDAIYVSLFGVKTREAAEAAVFAELFPAREKIRDWLHVGGDAAKGASAQGIGLGALPAAAASVFAAWMRKDIDDSKIIIFDDLERADMSAKELLGFINRYVEHDDCRVVAIAHDEKFIGDVSDAKEKLFGQRLHVQPDIESAFDAFVDEIPNASAQDFVEAHYETLATNFRESGVKSLRVLRQAMFDVARLFETLERRHRDNANAMRELVGVFSALDFEARVGRVTKAEILERPGVSLEGSDVASEGAIFAAAFATPDRHKSSQPRYTRVDVRSDILTGSVLSQMLFDGRYDSVQIAHALDDSVFFFDIRQQPLWRRIAHFESLDDFEVDDAVVLLQQQIDQRAIADLGDLLHIFALQLMMAHHGVVDKSFDAVEAECKACVDTLLAADRIAPMEAAQFDAAFGDMHAYGHAFWIQDAYRDVFTRLYAYLREKSQAALEKNFPAEAQKLLQLLTQDARKFVGAIGRDDAGAHDFARLPVLKAIAPERFVDAWLAAPRHDRAWLRIKRALEQRYEGAALIPNADLSSGWLVAEAEWIKGVIAEMQKRAEAATGFAKYRIERAIPQIGFPPSETHPV
jgi:hypothetical protein